MSDCCLNIVKPLAAVYATHSTASSSNTRRSCNTDESGELAPLTVVVELVTEVDISLSVNPPGRKTATRVAPFIAVS